MLIDYIKVRLSAIFSLNYSFTYDMYVIISIKLECFIFFYGKLQIILSGFLIIYFIQSIVLYK